MKQNLLILLVIFVVFNACKKEETDREKPVIDMNFAAAFPQNCDTLWFGEMFVFKARLSDNHELGAFIIEIHENFDHHAHSTESGTCTLMPEKEPINPFYYIQDFTIPEGTSEYEANVSIEIPELINNNMPDEGDYHFFIDLTDRQGWSERKGLSVKIMHRN